MTVSTMLSLLAQGFVTSLLIFALTLLFSMPLGLAVMFGRRSRITPLRGLIKAHISIMRGTPLMLQLMVVFYGPKLLLGVTVPGNWRFTAVIVAFVINYAAYFAEIYRGEGCGGQKCLLPRFIALHALGELFNLRLEHVLGQHAG